MIRRWLYYALAGGLFGIFDFFFQIWIYQIFPVESSGSLGMTAAILGIWLVLVVPIALTEARASGSVWRAAASSAFTWAVAVIAYYLFMGVFLIFIGQPGREEMHFSNRGDPFYWSNVQSFFAGDFVSGVSEWIMVAVVGGTLVGFVIGILASRANKLPFFKRTHLIQ